MNYVLITREESGFVVSQANRVKLAGTRDRDALNAFQNAVLTIFNTAAPDRIAIKLKPESGAMSAGAAAMKMEAIVLANAPCPAQFVSGARIKKCTATCGSLHAYHLHAFKAAAVIL